MWRDLQADLDRYRRLFRQPIGRARLLRFFLEEQGVWALCVYRFGRWGREAAPPALRPFCSAIYGVAFKLVEITTGISLPARARIGPGLYIGHFGGIQVHPDTVMGARCSISQGVTIGVAGRGKAGVPRVGDRVYIGAGAKVLGGVLVGDGAAIGANAVVLVDVPPGATAVGVPARIIERRDETSAALG